MKSFHFWLTDGTEVVIVGTHHQCTSIDEFVDVYNKEEVVGGVQAQWVKYWRVGDLPEEGE